VSSDSATRMVGDGVADTKNTAAGQPDVRIVYWLFVAFWAVFAIGVSVFGRIIPPPRPDVGPVQVQDWFAQHALTIKIGLVALLMVAGGWAVFIGLVGYHMKRMSSGSVLAYGFMGSMAVGAVPGLQLVMLCYLLAVFRPGRNPEVVAMFYDLGMLALNGSMGFFAAAYVTLAVAIFYDKNEIFPKYFAYVTIWQIVATVIGSQMWLFHSGAFAWNGMIAFWTGVAIFGTWLVLLIRLTRIAGRRETLDAHRSTGFPARAHS
jgi:hypothetical protein